MKNLLLVTTTMILLLLMGNCKKTDSDDPNSYDCINSSFTKSFDINLTPTYIEIDNKGNITILGNHDGTIKVARFNPDGELLWQREYTQLQGKEDGLIFIDENYFFIKTSTDSYTYELSEYSYEHIWIKNGNMLDLDNNYIPTFEISGLIQPKLQLENTNTTQLSKLNSDGDILWTKEFNGDFCNGESFYRIDNNNFLFLTSERYGPYFELVTYNGHTDTIDHPNDRNKQFVYKINNEGDIIWNTEINNIFNVSWDNYPFNGIKHSITQNQNKIIVNTLNNTFELSLSGELVNSFQPEYNYQGNWTYYMVQATETTNYFFGKPHEYDNYVLDNYLMKYDVETHQTIWQNRNVNFPSFISSYPAKGVITMDNNFVIDKFNIDGELLWQKEIPNLTWVMGACIKATCSGGLIIAVLPNPPAKLFVIKLDENGEYLY